MAPRPQAPRPSPGLRALLQLASFPLRVAAARCWRSVLGLCLLPVVFWPAGSFGKQPNRLGIATEASPRRDSPLGARFSSASSTRQRAASYSPECVEGEFSEIGAH